MQPARVENAKRSTAAKGKRNDIAAVDDKRMTAAKVLVVAAAVTMEGTTRDATAAVKSITKRKENVSTKTKTMTAKKCSGVP